MLNHAGSKLKIVAYIVLVVGVIGAVTTFIQAVDKHMNMFYGVAGAILLITVVTAFFLHAVGELCEDVKRIAEKHGVPLSQLDNAPSPFADLSCKQPCTMFHGAPFSDPDEPQVQYSVPVQIRMLKAKLENGEITQAEFEQKKQELLNQ